MGLSFGEIVVLAIVALIVIGPKDLPRLLRTAGRVIGQAKRAISDVRRETGLDDVLRGDFQDLERLADHIENMDPYKGDQPAQLPLPNMTDVHAQREREYPTIGADAHGLLPDDAPVYEDGPRYGSEDVVKTNGAETVTAASPHGDEEEPSHEASAPEVRAT